MINPSGEVWRDLPVGPDGSLTQKWLWWSGHLSSKDSAEITITADHLDGSAPAVEVRGSGGASTSPTSPSLGTFMVSGFELSEPGCWEVSARYRGESLGFVVWVADDRRAPSSATQKAEHTKMGSSNAEKGKTAFECPVTIPAQPGFVATKPENITYSKNFPAPDPWPREYPHQGMLWYGSEGLWMALAIDGDHGGRKSVWWSVNFPGGIVEEQPDVSVTWTRLDTDKPVVIDNGGKATNAFTAEEGWFMIAGIDPDQTGCWDVEASYNDATLSYVYEKTG